MQHDLARMFMLSFIAAGERHLIFIHSCLRLQYHLLLIMPKEMQKMRCIALTRVIRANHMYALKAGHTFLLDTNADADYWMSRSHFCRGASCGCPVSKVSAKAQTRHSLWALLPALNMHLHCRS